MKSSGSFKDEKETKSKLGTYLFLGVMVLIVVGVMYLSWSTDKKNEYKQEVGKTICRSYNWTYLGVYQRTFTQDYVKCQTNQTIYGDHHNISIPKFDIEIDVDWEYFKNGTQR